MPTQVLTLDVPVSLVGFPDRIGTVLYGINNNDQIAGSFHNIDKISAVTVGTDNGFVYSGTGGDVLTGVLPLGLNDTGEVVGSEIGRAHV